MFIEEESVYGCQSGLNKGPDISSSEVFVRWIRIPFRKATLRPLGQMLLAKLAVRSQLSPISKTKRGLIVGTIDHTAIDESRDSVDLFSWLYPLSSGTIDV